MNNQNSYYNQCQYSLYIHISLTSFYFIQQYSIQNPPPTPLFLTAIIPFLGPTQKALTAVCLELAVTSRKVYEQCVCRQPQQALTVLYLELAVTRGKMCECCVCRLQIALASIDSCMPRASCDQWQCVSGVCLDSLSKL